jgi:hypothetical protein
LNKLRTVFFIIFFLGLFSCVSKNKFAKLVTIENRKLSPSGNFMLELKEGDDNGIKYYYFIIFQTNNGIIYSCSDKFYRRFTYYLSWDDISDIVWCYSGDLGAFYWIFEDNKHWVKHTYFPNKVKNEYTPPEIFRKLRPTFFGECKNTPECKINLLI